MATSSRRQPGSIRKRGYIFKLPVSGGVIKVWAKRWAVLHSTNHEGVVRLEYFDNSEAEPKNENKRVILLRNCTGCIETTEFKSKPYAFQFSTQQGRHVFCVESKPDMESWIEEINDVIKEDRALAKKTMKKNSMSEIITSDPTSGHAPHVGTLMGVYNVSLSPTDLSQALNLSGTYSLDVTPKGMSLISNVTNTEITKWQYRHIKFYSKSSSNVVSVQLGRRSPTGEGKFLFQTTVAKELFSMIHRNIKKIKMAQDKRLKEEMEKEAERIREIKRRRAAEEESQQARMRTMPPKTSSLDTENERLRQQQQQHRLSYQRSSTIDPFTSASTIGTVANDDLIQLEGLADFPDFTDDDFLPSEMESFDKRLQEQSQTDRNRLSMGATFDESNKLELNSLNTLTSVVYQEIPGRQQVSSYNHRPPPPEPLIYDEVPKDGGMNSFITANGRKLGPNPAQTVTEIYDQPPQDGFGDSYVSSNTNRHQVQHEEPLYDQPPNTTNPFMNVTDPFSVSAQGSFFNKEEDIFQNFEQASSNRTSTPSTKNGVGGFNGQSTPAPQSGGGIGNQTYSNVDALRGLKDIQLDTTQRTMGRPPVALPRTLPRGASKKELDDMWGDIAKDFKL